MSLSAAVARVSSNIEDTSNMREFFSANSAVLHTITICCEGRQLRDAVMATRYTTATVPPRRAHPPRQMPAT